MERKKKDFRENWHVFLRIWGEAELILMIWGVKENTFRELRNFLSGTWEDQCIIFKNQGGTDPPGGLILIFTFAFIQCQFILRSTMNPMYIKCD